MAYVFLNYPCGPFPTITRIIESKLYLHLKTDENFNSQKKKLSPKYYFIAMIRASLIC